jgi:hypothetical protein
MKILISGLVIGTLAGFCGTAFAVDSTEYQAEVAVADGDYQAALQGCSALGAESRTQCMDNARVTRQNAIENARARATTVTIIHPQPMPGTTPADRADALVAAQQKIYAAP